MLVSDLASPLNSEGWDGTKELRRKTGIVKGRQHTSFILTDYIYCLTSSLGYNLQVRGQRSISDRGESQHSDVISLVRSQTLDGDEAGAAHHLLLPLHDRSTQHDA